MPSRRVLSIERPNRITQGVLVKSWLKQVRQLGAVAAAAAAFAACDEQLSGGIACPSLCPGPALTLRDTTLFAIEFDTSIVGFPAFGAEARFYLATFGDTLETAAAVRFDSLPKTFRRLNSVDDSSIVTIDTGSYVKLFILRGDTLETAPTTVEVYDIDMDGEEDLDPLAVTAAFTPDRLLGSRTVPADSLRDSVKVLIDPDYLLGKIQTAGTASRVRLGVKVTQAGNPRMTMLTDNGGGGAVIIFRPSTDTTVPKLIVEPLSRTPTEPQLASDFRDYLVVLRSPPPPPFFVMRVGGLPARRAYLRFEIPSEILDSTNVVRATLLLTQRANSFAPEPMDTVSLGHFGVVAGPLITDLTRALSFLQRVQNTDTLSMVAADSGVRNFEMIDWVRQWRGTTPDKTPRAMAIATTAEGEVARLVDFYNIQADSAVRPRLRLTYLPRAAGPLP